jgi:hypothetical protein
MRVNLGHSPGADYSLFAGEKSPIQNEVVMATLKKRRGTWGKIAMVIQLITEQTASHARLIDTPEIRLPANDELRKFGFHAVPYRTQQLFTRIP